MPLEATRDEFVLYEPVQADAPTMGSVTGRCGKENVVGVRSKLEVHFESMPPRSYADARVAATRNL